MNATPLAKTILVVARVPAVRAGIAGALRLRLTQVDVKEASTYAEIILLISNRRPDFAVIHIDDRRAVNMIHMLKKIEGTILVASFADPTFQALCPQLSNVVARFDDSPSFAMLTDTVSALIGART